VIAVTGDDEDNMLICQVAKEKYLCQRIVARVNNPRNLQHFKLLGIQPAVSATDLILRLIEHEVPQYGLVQLLALEEERLEIIELEVGSAPWPPAGASRRCCCPTARSSSPFCAAEPDSFPRRHRDRSWRRGPADPRSRPRERHHTAVRPQRRGPRWLIDTSTTC